MDELDRVLRSLSSDDEDFALKRGVELFTQNNYVAAIEVLSSLVGGLPISSRDDEAAAHRHLARCYEALGQVERGYREHLLVLECLPLKECVGDWQKAMRETSQIELDLYVKEHPDVLKR